MPGTKFEIIDTLILRNNEIFLKPYHMERTFEAYQFLGLNLSFLQVKGCYDHIENYLQQQNLEGWTLRLVFSPIDPTDFKIDLKANFKIDSPVRLCLHTTNELPEPSRNFKFNDRDHWDALLRSKPEGFDDVLLANSNSFAIETSRFNLFLYDEKTDQVYTPELNTGCINGVYRRYALHQNKIYLPELGLKKIIEMNFTIQQIDSNNLYVANSVREVLKAAFIPG